jgi:hypothetical protein
MWVLLFMVFVGSFFQSRCMLQFWGEWINRKALGSIDGKWKGGYKRPPSCFFHGSEQDVTHPLQLLGSRPVQADIGSMNTI